MSNLYVGYENELIDQSVVTNTTELVEVRDLYFVFDDTNEAINEIWPEDNLEEKELYQPTI